MAERSKALQLSCRGLAGCGFRIPLETYIFILKFSLPPRSEQANGAVANEIKHVHSPEVIVVLDPRYDLSYKALYISTCSIALRWCGSVWLIFAVIAWTRFEQNMKWWICGILHHVKMQIPEKGWVQYVKSWLHLSVQNFMLSKQGCGNWLDIFCMWIKPHSVEKFALIRAQKLKGTANCFDQTYVVLYVHLSLIFTIWTDFINCSKGSAVVLWLVEQEVCGSNPGLAATISEIGYLLLPSRDMAQRSLKRRKKSKQPTNQQKLLNRFWRNLISSKYSMFSTKCYLLSASLFFQ